VAKKKKVKTIVGSVLGWIIGLFFALVGILNIFSHFIAGLFTLLIAVLLIPPIYRFIIKKLNIKMNIWKKTGIIVIALIIVVVLTNQPPSSTCGDSVCQISESCSTCEEDCGVCASCGDSICQNSETCSTCGEDCGKCFDEVEDKVKESIVYIKNTFEGKRSNGTLINSVWTGTGVIYSVQGNEVSVYTNRHIVDTYVFQGSKVNQLINQEVTVRTQDGITHTVKNIRFFPLGIDVASLTFTAPSFNQYTPATRSKKESFGKDETLYLVGYPSEVNPPLVRFTIDQNEIFATDELLTVDGDEFGVILHTGHMKVGQTGGGLFDENGDLIGLNFFSLKDTESSTAIDLDSVTSNYLLRSCINGFYMRGNFCAKICKKSQVQGEDGTCYDPCTAFYCSSGIPITKSDRCVAHKTLGNDNFCHPACGTPTAWCAQGALCYKGTCFDCKSPGFIMWKDGTCRLNQGGPPITIDYNAIKFS